MAEWPDPEVSKGSAASKSELCGADRRYSCLHPLDGHLQV